MSFFYVTCYMTIEFRLYNVKPKYYVVDFCTLTINTMFFSGFQFIVALKMGDIIMIVKTIIVQCTLLTQMFAYSYVGEYMKYQIEEVAHAIFSSNWYFLSIKLTKNILFVITRSQDPIQLAAGKFIVVNMETFMSIIKTSLSYLSMLRVMVET